MVTFFQVNEEDMVLYGIFETGDSVEDKKYFSSKSINFLFSIQ